MQSGVGDGVETVLVPCRVSPSTVLGLDLISEGGTSAQQPGQRGGAGFSAEPGL